MIQVTKFDSILMYGRWEGASLPSFALISEKCGLDDRGLPVVSVEIDDKLHPIGSEALTAFGKKIIGAPFHFEPAWPDLLTKKLRIRTRFRIGCMCELKYDGMSNMGKVPALTAELSIPIDGLVDWVSVLDACRYLGAVCILTTQFEIGLIVDYANGKILEVGPTRPRAIENALRQSPVPVSDM